MVVLGIETSCDETAAAVVEDGKKLLSNVVASSLDLHIPFGGVVPEIAARSHLEVILPTIDQALTDAFQGPALEMEKMWSGIDAIAVTQGPGLLGSLLIGVITARTLAIAKNKPLYAVNHVEAHVYSTFITDASGLLSTHYSLPTTAPKFPILALIVSGGHTQLVLFQDHFKHKVLGQTRDDAVGEAFNKVAKSLGFPYPGGPSIAKAAQKGSPDSISLPEVKMESPYDFSFSGLKTAVLRAGQSLSSLSYDFPSTQLPGALDEAQKADLAASFQKAAIDTLARALRRAELRYGPRSIVVAGGVAANQELRRTISEQIGTDVSYPDIKLCTDNAAMVATLGCFKLLRKQPDADSYSLEPDPGLRMR